MSFEIVLRKEAQIDVDEIFIWYEEQRIGLGVEFINEFEKVLQKITTNPYYPSFIELDARSASLKRFPYQLIYRVDEARTQVRIIAVTHHRRSPQWFSQRRR